MRPGYVYNKLVEDARFDCQWRHGLAGRDFEEWVKTNKATTAELQQLHDILYAEHRQLCRRHYVIKAFMARVLVCEALMRAKGRTAGSPQALKLRTFRNFGYLDWMRQQALRVQREADARTYGGGQ